MTATLRVLGNRGGGSTRGLMGSIGRFGLWLLAGCLIGLAGAQTASSSQTALTWGQGANGELGNGTLVNDSSVPLGACELGSMGPCATGPNLREPIAIANNGDHGMALLANGTVAGWGYDGFGEVGDGATALKDTPTAVCAVGATPPCTAGNGNLLQGVASVGAGVFFSVAVLDNGQVVTWGDNSFGQLGNGTSSNSSVPVRVCAVGVSSCPNGPYLSGVEEIAVGYSHVLGVLSDGTVVSWGFGSTGDLGDSNVSPGSSNVPVQVCAVGVNTCVGGPYLFDVTSIAAGEQHSLAVLKGGTVVAWGLDNVGQIGSGLPLFEVGQVAGTPVYVCAVGATAPCDPANGNALTEATAVAAGELHSLALMGNGTAVAWGNDTEGELGDGLTNSAAGLPVPVPVCAVGAVAPCSAANGNLLTGVSALAGGFRFSLALMNNGTMTAWGDEVQGLLGNGALPTIPSSANSNVPVPVCAVGAFAPCTAANANVQTGVSAISAGQEGSIAIAPTPAAGPHWYKKNLELTPGAAHVTATTKGTLTLHALGKEAVCKVVDGEELWNRIGGGGEDSITAFALTCKTSKLCPHTTTEVIASTLPWPSHLIAGSPIRDQIEQIEIEVKCSGSYLDTFLGTLTPEVGNGVLDFGSGSGSLHDLSGNPATLTGSDKLTAAPGKVTAQ
jgi:alpha-tubulin suppressor-like RCC1 family protein